VEVKFLDPEVAEGARKRGLGDRRFFLCGQSSQFRGGMEAVMADGRWS